jgi:hypothetical protein
MSRIRDRKTDTNYFRLKLKANGDSKTRTYLKRLSKLMNTPVICDEITKRTFIALRDEMLYGIQPR